MNIFSIKLNLVTKRKVYNIETDTHTPTHKQTYTNTTSFRFINSIHERINYVVFFFHLIIILKQKTQ